MKKVTPSNMGRKGCSQKGGGTPFRFFMCSLLLQFDLYFSRTEDERLDKKVKKFDIERGEVASKNIILDFLFESPLIIFNSSLS